MNKKLGGTVFQGLGAFLFATFVAFVIGIVRVGIDSRFTELDWSTVVSYFTQVFTVSQVWFYLIVQKLSLDVKA
ncbi:MAG: hypothetical protein M1308_21755 [Actinobacteria bacterium]|nr:hypothetical protein [Actinomycetota bacterium]